jgi:hypothetical protein
MRRAKSVQTRRPSIQTCDGLRSMASHSCNIVDPARVQLPRASSVRLAERDRRGPGHEQRDRNRGGAGRTDRQAHDPHSSCGKARQCQSESPRCGRFAKRWVLSTTSLLALGAELREVNGRLWDIEDEIRDCELRQDFGAAFIELARAVLSDQREINSPGIGAYRGKILSALESRREVRRQSDSTM